MKTSDSDSMLHDVIFRTESVEEELSKFSMSWQATDPSMASVHDKFNSFNASSLDIVLQVQNAILAGGHSIIMYKVVDTVFKTRKKCVKPPTHKISTKCLLNIPRPLKTTSEMHKVSTSA